MAKKKVSKEVDVKNDYIKARDANRKSPSKANLAKFRKAREAYIKQRQK